MDPVDRKRYFPVDEAPHLEVEPTLGVALVVSALCVSCSPYTVVVVGSTYSSMHVARIEPTLEEDMGLSGLGELKAVALR